MTTPSEQATQNANETVEIFDANGRSIKLRKPGMLAQYRLVGRVGNQEDSETYLNMCMPLLFVYSIDGDDSIHFASHREMEGVISRLGDAGVKAVMLGVQEHFSETISPDARKDEIKK
jgi:hypothetical protein